MLDKNKLLLSLGTVQWETGVTRGKFVFTNQQLAIVREQIEKAQVKDVELDQYCAEPDLD